MSKRWQGLFWEKVRKTRTCWIWIAGTDKDGYGKFGTTNTNSRSYSETGECRSHRISWVLAHGPIPDGKFVCHKCDTPGCVNPRHLWLGTIKSNAEDRVDKGRGRRMDGQHNPNSKLTPAIIRRIRKASSSGVRRTAIASLYSIHPMHVSLITRRKIWRSVR